MEFYDNTTRAFELKNVTMGGSDFKIIKKFSLPKSMKHSVCTALPSPRKIKVFLAHF